MPIYEYRCLSCEQLSEFFLRVSDPHPESCPRCGEAGALRKQISQTSFSLKGEGWYVTDYKKPAGSKTKEGDPQQPVSEDSVSKDSKPESGEGGGGGGLDKATPAAAAAQSQAPVASSKPSVGKDSSSSSGSAGGSSSGS